jgi:hypothetical protein
MEISRDTLFAMLVAAVCAWAVATCVPGCAGMKQQVAQPPPPPVGSNGEQHTTTQQGVVPVSNRDLTGLIYNKNVDLSFGLAALLGWDKWLSHRRQMLRIKRCSYASNLMDGDK